MKAPARYPHVRKDRLDGREELRAVCATRRSIPAVIALDSDYVERSWWGPRPAALHRWVLGEGQALDKSERYKHVRAWYARDHALTKLGEVVAMMEGEAQG
jgi:hypothetical protein